MLIEHWTNLTGTIFGADFELFHTGIFAVTIVYTVVDATG